MKTQKIEEQPNKVVDNKAEPDGQIEDKQRKTAFMITPVGSDISDIRRAAEGVIDAVIIPVLEKHNIDLTVPHRIDDIGNITNQVIKLIVEADLVIANLTTLNANVMYELAVRHAKRLPVIIIAEEGTKLPFDVTTERTFFYANDMAGVKKLFGQLDKTVPRALLDNNPSNPIYNAISDSLIKELVNKEGSDFEKYVIQRLGQIGESIASINYKAPNPPVDIKRRNIEPGDIRKPFYRSNIKFNQVLTPDQEAYVNDLIALVYPDASGHLNFINSEAQTENVTFETNNYNPNVDLHTYLKEKGFNVSTTSFLLVD